ncbi:MAG: nuclear transport factor 2 family protein [Ilumatobacteraceae bacterium]
MSAVDVVTEYLTSFSFGDPETIAGFVADGFRNEHLSALGSGTVGREAYLGRLPDFLGSFTERAYSIDDVIEHARDAVIDVVVRYRFTATYEDQRIDIPGVMWFGTRDGKLVSRLDTWDSLTFLRQTGQAD